MEITLNAVTGAASIIGIVIVFIRQISNRAKLDAMIMDLKSDLSALQTDQEKTDLSLTAFELRATQTFASNIMLERMETRMLSAMDRLGDRIDKSITAKVG